MIFQDDFDDGALGDRWKIYKTYLGKIVDPGDVTESAGNLHIAVNAGDKQRVVGAYLRHPVGNIRKLEIQVDAVTFATAEPSGSQNLSIGVAVQVRDRLPFTSAAVVLSKSGSSTDCVRARFTEFEEEYVSLALPTAPFKVSITRYDSLLRVCIDDVLVNTITDFSDLPVYVGIMLESSADWGACSVDIASFDIEFESPIGVLLWDLLPEWLKTYPLEISSSGDLAMTKNGVICLLQDIADLLDTEVGDLYGHAETGAGLSRFLGQAYSDLNTEPVRRLSAQIKSALKSEGVAPRLVTEKTSVTVTMVEENKFEVQINVVAQDGETVLPLNLVYQYGIDSLGNLYADPPTAAQTTTPVGPDGYEYPGLGKDLLLDRSDDYMALDENARWELPQYIITERLGMELDHNRMELALMRDNLAVLTADTTSLTDLITRRNLVRLSDEPDWECKERYRDEFEQKHKDGRVDGLEELCEFYGWDATCTEGFTMSGTPEVPNLHWAELWLDMTAVDGTIGLRQLEFFRIINRRQRAGRRIVYGNIAGNGRTWNQDTWNFGWFSDNDAFQGSCVP